MTYQVKDGFVVRKIGTQTMAVPVGQRSTEIHGMIALTESGAMLWELLENGADLDTLTEKILREYEIDIDTARSDVLKYLEELSSQGVLR